MKITVERKNRGNLQIEDEIVLNNGEKCIIIYDSIEIPYSYLCEKEDGSQIYISNDDFNIPTGTTLNLGKPKYTDDIKILVKIIGGIITLNYKKGDTLFINNKNIDRPSQKYELQEVGEEGFIGKILPKRDKDLSTIVRYFDIISSNRNDFDNLEIILNCL